MVLSSLLEAIANILHTLINIYIWIIIASAIISWVRPDPYNQIVQLLYRLTQPVYDMIRKVIPTVFGGIDIAPIIVLLALQFLDQFLVKLLLKLAIGL